MEEVWDFIILGGGSAGCTLAEVLSRGGKFSVLLLEAGDDVRNDPFLLVPRNNIPATNMTYYWPGNTLPDVTARDASGGPRIFPWTNGMGLGGGSAVNGMITTRGTVQRYNEWAALAGPQWSGENVYRVMKENERFFGPTPFPEEHGYTGRLQIRVGVSDSRSTTDTVEAVLSTGVPGAVLIEDPNTRQTPLGVFRNTQYYQTPNSLRASNANDFLSPDVIDFEGNGLGGRRLKVIVRSRALRIVYADCGRNRATAILATVNGIPQQFNVRSKLIVSMGFNSAAFLQVNGIGPADTLNRAGVQVRIDSPGVGRGLKNPYYVPSVLLPPPGVVRNSNPSDLNTSGAFLPDPRPGKPTNIRNVQLSTLFTNLNRSGIGPEFLGFLVVVEAPLRAQSSGTIDIQNSDPLKIANVDMRFLGDPDDLEMTAAVYTLIIRPMYLNLMTKGYVPLAPTIATIDDPVALRAFIGASVGNDHHYMCSNRMGPGDDAPLDGWCNVKGSDNIMVVDDSSAPLCNDGNTNYPATIIALIVGDYLYNNTKPGPIPKPEKPFHKNFKTSLKFEC